MHNILQRNRFAQRLRIGYKHRRPIRVTEISNKIFTDIHWSLAINQTIVYGQINVYGVTTKSERHKRSYWTRTADGNGIGGRKAPVPYGS